MPLFLAGSGGIACRRRGFVAATPVEMGLTAVVATQLWHHRFMGGGLADLPEWSSAKVNPM
jgi:hypothetical protein